MEHWYLYVAFGTACGIFGATLGIGSGVLMVPMLVLLMHFPQKVAQGISLAVIAPMALVGAFRYKLNLKGDMDMTIVALLAAGAVLGAVLGSHVAMCLSGATLRRIFSVVMILIGLRMFIITDSVEKSCGPAGPGDADRPLSAATAPAATESGRDRAAPARKKEGSERGDENGGGIRSAGDGGNGAGKGSGGRP